MLLAAAAALAAAGPPSRQSRPRSYGGAAGMVHSGTPAGVPADTDCALRRFAHEYGRKLAPERGEFKSLFDALQLGACGDQPPAEQDEWAPPTTPIPSGHSVVHASPGASPSGANGTAAAPFPTLEAAVEHSRKVPRPVAVVLHSGTYHLSRTVDLTARDSGLTIMNAPGETAVVSGGRPVDAKWAASSRCKGCYETKTGGVAVPGLRRNGAREIRARWPNFDPERDSVYGVHDGTTGWCNGETQWIGEGHDMNGVAGRWPPTTLSTLYQVNRTHWPSVQWDDYVKVNGQDMPLDGASGEGAVGNFFIGVNGTCVDRTPPAGHFCAVQLVGSGAANHPAGFVSGGYGNAPYKKPKGAVVHTWRVGHWYTNIFEVRGYENSGTTKPTTYPNTNNVFGRCQSPSQCGAGISPIGEVGSLAECEAAAAKAVNATAVTWHHPDFQPPWGGYCFAATDGSWNPGLQPKVDSIRMPHSGVTYLSFEKGGFQGAEGVTAGQGWYIENVVEELDAEREFFYDADDGVLVYKPNSSDPSAVAADGSPAAADWTATNLKELITITGTQQAPVSNVKIAGLTLRDTAYTYFEPHGLPSGGDWGLQKTGAVRVAGAKDISITGNLFTRLDGIGLYMGGYVRGMMVNENEFAYIGGSAMASWGDTSYNLDEAGDIVLPWKIGPDGRGGDQPRGTQVLGNIAHDVGIWEKQSSMWFQAVTAQTQMHGNVFYNGPRAGINFNDGFGGGDDVSGNLVMNACRESSDHGPYNSWDRMPYITELRYGAGRPSVVPADRELHHNFFLGTYNSLSTIDTDDGSCYLKVHHNFLAYGDVGLKHDFGGHDETYTENVLAWVGDCWYVWWFRAYNDAFYNNTCVYHGAPESSVPYPSDCFQPGKEAGWRVGNNSVYSASGDENVCGTTLSKWVAQGHDKGTTIAPWPPVAEVVGWGRALLDL
eukprot:TRINITY_DN3630_c3_g1_i1.p1 TRINITY_DN3630_c3_g1~~TRINITY_DN3630_c3_g1_i1.p1  ORF type:complete len:967 (+),score=267.54 TRINITY_DN3630_c3_g1_i1:85-2901(+)